MNDRTAPQAALEQPPASYAGRTRFTQLEYEAVLANAWIGIAFTRDRKFFLCNPRFAEMLGWKPEELIGQPGEVVYPSRESYEALGRIAVPVLSAGKQLDLDWEVRRKDGSTFLARIIAKAISESDPRRGTVWIVDDVTDARRHGEQVARLLREQEAIFETASIGIVFVRDHRVARCNRRFEQMHGYAPNELIGRPTSIFFASEADRAHMPEVYARLRRGEQVEEVAARVRKDGSAFTVRTVGRAIDPADPKRGVVWITEDITEQRRAESELQRLLAEQEALLDNVVVGIAFTRERKLMRCNRRFEELFGYEPGGANGASARQVYFTDEEFEQAAANYAELDRGGTHRREQWLRRRDGSGFWCRLSGRALQPGDPARGAVWLFEDISAERAAREELERMVGERTAELREAREHAQHLADHDPLTGLPNRRLLEDRLTQALALSQRNRKQTAVMFVDLDRFKAINDSLGHTVGDAVLKEVASRLVKQLRVGDTVCRIGGDEFVVVLPESKRSTDAANVAAKILETLSQPVQVADRELAVTPSIGIAVFPEDGRDAAMLIRNADAAMYHAKESGRANYQFFTEQMNQAASRRLALEADLRGAAQKGELALHYQPIVSLKDGAVAGQEALLRWQHPQRGLVPPAEFVPLAEETGIILAIGEWALREACRWGTFIGVEHGVEIAVNLSARQFNDPKLIELVRRVLAGSGLPPRLLALEITETTAMQQTDVTASTLKKLKELGVSLVIDDFGTGYSSLAYLRRFPVDRLKIDRSFVADVPGDRNAESLIGGIVGLAHALGLTVIAEGVETEAQRDCVARLGCDLAQGYLIGHPADGDAASEGYV
ncbi:MAG: EAL domain-containing protein [Burkholderiales bacterium]